MGEEKVEKRVGKLLVVDDDLILLGELKKNLESQGYSVTTATDGMAGLMLCLKEDFDLVLTDIRMPKMGGREMLRKIFMKNPRIPVIVMTAYGNIQEAVKTIKEGVKDYVIKPFNWDDLYGRIGRTLDLSKVDLARNRFQEQVSPRRKTDYIISQNKLMEEIFALITLAGKRKEPVIIIGEEGTEKNKIARALHFSGTRARGSFVEINCGIFSEKLIWNDLVGNKNSTGQLLHQAMNGTIHFEDVHKLSIHYLQELMEVLKLYYPHTENDAVRFVFSFTPAEYKANEFSGIIIKVPPLRDRIDDIPMLAYYFLEEVISQFHKRVDGFTDDAVKKLLSYSWPDNVHELQQKVRDAVMLTTKQLISPDDLLLESYMDYTTPISFKEAKRRFEFNYVTSLLRFSGGNVSRAAQIAHKDRKDFYYLMRKHKMNSKDFK